MYDDFVSEEKPENCTHSLTQSLLTGPRAKKEAGFCLASKKHLKEKKHAWPAATGSVKKKSKGERERREEYIKCKSNSLTR